MKPELKAQPAEIGEAIQGAYFAFNDRLMGLNKASADLANAAADEVARLRYLLLLARIPQTHDVPDACLIVEGEGVEAHCWLCKVKADTDPDAPANAAYDRTTGGVKAREAQPEAAP